MPLPLVLFSAGEVGFWADVHPTRLWQDTARTIPVVSSGDPVASWMLSTTSGVIYATQSTAGNRPVYKVDSSGNSYLEFDGATSNRFLVTTTITPGTDKVQVFAGMRKDTNATRGMVAELTSTPTLNSFSLFNANSTSGDIAWVSRGSAVATVISPLYSAPATQVLTAIGDVSGDSAILRVGGAQVGQSVVDQGTGNYSAAPIWIGMRGGASVPLVGRIYGLIVRFGPNLDTATIAATERWMATKTGVVL